MVTNGAGTITESYVFGPLGIRRINHGPPTVSGGANTNYDLNFADGIGNTAGTINSSGTRTNTYTYDAFGTPDQTSPTNTLTDRFLGKNGGPLDTLSGLILMGARPYDSTTGRFLSADPIQGGSASLFDYVNQDPLNETDPTGTCASTSLASGGQPPGTSPGKCSKSKQGRMWKNPLTGIWYKCTRELGEGWRWKPQFGPHPTPDDSPDDDDEDDAPGYHFTPSPSKKSPIVIALPSFGFLTR
jgi:RHS repeat-associated protein